MTIKFNAATGFLEISSKSGAERAAMFELHKTLKAAGSNLTTITEDGSTLSVPVIVGPKTLHTQEPQRDGFEHGDPGPNR